MTRETIPWAGLLAAARRGDVTATTALLARMGPAIRAQARWSPPAWREDVVADVQLILLVAIRRSGAVCRDRGVSGRDNVCKGAKGAAIPDD